MKDLAKDASTVLKIASYKRVAAMLSDEEKERTKVQLEFISNVFQKSCPQGHILHVKLCEFLLKLMCRFLKTSAYKSMRGSKMQDVDCGRSNQLSDSEIIIEDPAEKVLAFLSQIIRGW